MRWKGSPRSLKEQARQEPCSGKHHLLQGGEVHHYEKSRDEPSILLIIYKQHKKSYKKAYHMGSFRPHRLKNEEGKILRPVSFHHLLVKRSGTWHIVLPRFYVENLLIYFLFLFIGNSAEAQGGKCPVRYPVDEIRDKDMAKRNADKQFTISGHLNFSPSIPLSEIYYKEKTEGICTKEVMSEIQTVDCFSFYGFLNFVLPF